MFPGKFLFILTFAILIPGGAFLPTSAIGGMILVSLQEVEEEVSWESARGMGRESVPTDCPQYLPDDNQASSFGGDHASPTGPTAIALHAMTQPFVFQTIVSANPQYSHPLQPPPHLCRLFRPPRS